MEKTSNNEFYTVQSGDGWYRIAQRTGVDLKTLHELNGTSNKTPLYKGNLIRIRKAKSTPMSSKPTKTATLSKPATTPTSDRSWGRRILDAVGNFVSGGASLENGAVEATRQAGAGAIATGTRVMNRLMPRISHETYKLSLDAQHAKDTTPYEGIYDLEEAVEGETPELKYERNKRNYNKQQALINWLTKVPLRPRGLAMRNHDTDYYGNRYNADGSYNKEGTGTGMTDATIIAFAQNENAKAREYLAANPNLPLLVVNHYKEFIKGNDEIIANPKIIRSNRGFGFGCIYSASEKLALNNEWFKKNYGSLGYEQREFNYDDLLLNDLVLFVETNGNKAHHMMKVVGFNKYGLPIFGQAGGSGLGHDDKQFVVYTKKNFEDSREAKDNTEALRNTPHYFYTYRLTGTPKLKKAWSARIGMKLIPRRYGTF